MIYRPTGDPNMIYRSTGDSNMIYRSTGDSNMFYHKHVILTWSWPHWTKFMIYLIYSKLN